MLRVLLIDDNPDDRILVIHQLNREFPEAEVKQIVDPQSFAEAKTAANFDIVITDYQLLWSDGLTILREIKAVCPDCPVIMFTNSGTQEVAVSAMKAGLDDYVIKAPKHYIRLVAAVRLALERQETLRKSALLEIRLQSLLQRLEVGVFRCTLSGRLLEANGTFLQLLGVSTLAEAQKLNLHEVFFQSSQRSQMLLRLQQKGQLSQREIQLRQANGNIIWVSWNKIVTWEEGEIFVDGLVEDISERKRLQAAHFESEERFRVMADAAPVFLWMSGVDKLCYFFNRSWLGFTGRTIQQEMGNGWLDNVHPEDLHTFLHTYNTAFDSQKTFSIEYRLRHCDGEYRWILNTGTPRFMPDGSFVGYIGSCIDITSGKQLEDTLRQNTEELTAAHRLKDEFLTTLSHELRTPLNAILGWSNAMQTGVVNQQLPARAIEAIQRNAKRQVRLVEDLLDVSNIIQGKLQLGVAPIDLSAAIADAVFAIKPAADAKKIHLEVKINADVCLVLGDRDRLQQIVWNLLCNAVKFTPEAGKVRVQLSKVLGTGDWGLGNNLPKSPIPNPEPQQTKEEERRKKEEGTRLPTNNYQLSTNSANPESPITYYAQLQVTDTGIGISPNFLPYVFERFRQADSSTTRRYEGLGLGLAIVRHLAELHGGTVWAESQGLGQGATFSVKIPLLQQVNMTPTVEQKAGNANSQILAGLHILVVDDEADVRDLLTFTLELFGAEVTTVSSAAAALKAMGESVPDLLLSDIGMPEEDGYNLIRQVRSLQAPRGGEIPAIALTAYAEDSEQQSAILAGFGLHLSKPIAPDKLVEAIAMLTGRDDNC